MRFTKTFLVVIGLLTLSTSSGCRSPYRADQGAAIGGIGGGVLGAIVGKQLGNTAGGAAIGAVSGLVAGSLIGQELDDIEARNQAQIEAQLGRQLIAGAVPMEDVIAMSKAGVDDSLIINQINTKGFRGTLNAQDLIMLTEQGVSPTVVRAMQTPVLRQAKSVPSGRRPVVIEEHYYSTPHYYHHPHRHRHYHHGHRPGWEISYGNH